MNSRSTPQSVAAELLGAVAETLQQGETLLRLLDDAAYRRKVPTAFNASIGGHYRHCLDHFRRLLDATAAGDLDYDCRERGTPVEQDRFAALNATRALREGFAELDATVLERELLVTCKTSYAASGSQHAPSTIGREIMYAVAHAVHHYALIGIMADLMGVRLPAGLGIAPSTLQHQAGVAASAP